ncbi:MAG: DUF677 domain-containing protein [Candidatus Vogelbacteria bacterium]|nr:DUF677 domain-containing protein [Candidatus Vogelbacteria bacterium]
MSKKRKSKKNKRFNLEKISTKATAWIGSTESLAVHTALFISAFLLGLLGVNWDRVLLVLTTIVSLEAIYLAIFIQMTVNRNTASLEEVEEDIEEIQAGVDTIQEDVDEMQQDVDEIQHNVDEIQQDVDEIEKQDDEIEDMTVATLETIKKQIEILTKNIEDLRKQ